jgi:hypothetical protein
MMIIDEQSESTTRLSTPAPTPCGRWQSHGLRMTTVLRQTFIHHSLVLVLVQTSDQLFRSKLEFQSTAHTSAG